MLKLTLASGDVVETEFSAASTLTVANQVQVQPGESFTDSKSWSEVVGIEIVDDPAPPEPIPAPPAAVPSLPEEPDQDTADPATLETPAAALEHAVTLPLEDAKAHVDAALEKFPDDADLLAAKADLDDETSQTS